MMSMDQWINGSMDHWITRIRRRWSTAVVGNNRDRTSPRRRDLQRVVSRDGGDGGVLDDQPKVEVLVTVAAKDSDPARRRHFPLRPCSETSGSSSRRLCCPYVRRVNWSEKRDVMFGMLRFRTVVAVTWRARIDRHANKSRWRKAAAPTLYYETRSVKVSAEVGGRGEKLNPKIRTRKREAGLGCSNDALHPFLLSGLLT